MKVMISKKTSICRICGEPITPGQKIKYYGPKWGAKHFGCDNRGVKIETPTAEDAWLDAYYENGGYYEAVTGERI